MPQAAKQGHEICFGVFEEQLGKPTSPTQDVLTTGHTTGTEHVH